MMAGLGNWDERIEHELWEKDPAQHGRLGRLLVPPARIVYGVARKFADGQLTLQAMSLVYTTLLSLVPLLAVSFSVLKALGVPNQLEPVLLEFLAPLGDQAQRISERLLNFVDNMQVGVLGSLGIALLFYTVISLVQKVEQAFNYIWHVPGGRNLARRFSDYLSVILIGPVLIFSALGVTASVLDSSVVQWLASIQPFGTVILVASRLIPYLLICVAFAFLYGFLPNTAVQLRAALIGGVFAGVLWYTTGVIFAVFVVNSSNYSAIYSGFAGAVLFMIWLYVGWLIILVGAQVAFYCQNPRYLDPRLENLVVSSRRREELALEIMTLVGRAHYCQEPGCTFEDLKSHAQGIDPDGLARLVGTLEAARLIVASADTPARYLPGHDIETIRLADVVATARGARPEMDSDLPTVAAVMQQIDDAIARALKERTLRDLIRDTEWDRARSAGSSGEAARG